MAKSPSEFSKMYHTFWSGRTGKALRGDGEAQAIQYYLIDNAHGNMWGLYYLPKVYITYDTGHSEKVVNRVLKKLGELEFAYYDEETEYVFVVEMAHKQVGVLKNGDNRIGSANRFYRDVADNPFLGMFYDRYCQELDLSTKRRDSEGASKGLTRGLQDPPKSLPRDHADVDADAPSSSGSKEVEEKERPISYDRVIELWNEVAKKYDLPTVRKLTDELKDGIKKASRALPYQKDWEDMLAEIPLSSTLQGRIGDGTWAPSLSWMLKTNRGELEPNYSKAMNGAWRDKNVSGRDYHLQKGIDAANRMLAK